MIGFFAAQSMSQEARLWTPADLPIQPHIWVDWDSPVTNASGAASSWDNTKGVLGGSFSQATAARRPSIIAVDPVIGKRMLRFDGDYFRMETAAAGNIFRSTGAGWCFSVLKKRGTDIANTARVVVYAPNGTDAATRFQVAVGGVAPPNSNALAARRLDGDSTATMSADAAPGEWVLRYDEINWATGEAAIHIDGALGASNSTLTSAGTTSDTGGVNNRLSLGAAATFDPEAYGDIDVACVILGSGSLPSASEREKLEGWAAWQCGLQDSLPIGHPYKDAPPTV